MKESVRAITPVTLEDLVHARWLGMTEFRRKIRIVCDSAEAGVIYVLTAKSGIRGVLAQHDPERWGTPTQTISRKELKENSDQHFAAVNGQGAVIRVLGQRRRRASNLPGAVLLRAPIYGGDQASFELWLRQKKQKEL